MKLSKQANEKTETNKRTAVGIINGSQEKVKPWLDSENNTKKRFFRN